MSEININSNNHSDIEISENNFIDVELDNGDIENIETEIKEPDCIEIEINGLMSSNSFIGLEDTPMYYIDGKFFKVEGNKLVYTDIDWADITGDLKDSPQLEDQIKEIASQYSKEFIVESVKNAVEKHNLDEKSHPFLIDMILTNYELINKKVDQGLKSVNARVDNLELTTNTNTDNINVLLDEQVDINTSLGNVKYDVVKNATDITNLTPRVTNNESKIIELNEKIKDIAGADLTELNNRVNKNSGNITNLTQKVDNNYHELSLNAQNNFDVLNNKIADNALNINTNTQDITDIKLKSTTDYTELKNKINSNSTKIDVNTKDIYQNTLNINQNTLAISDNSRLINSTIENLKSYSKTSAFAKVAFSGEYTDLLNTPDIPSIEGLASTNYVNEYVNNAISGVVGLKFIVVDKLPEVGKNGYIYLVPDSKGTQDVYTEYIWLEDQQRFEQFGLSEVNLENYYTKDIVDGLLDTKVDKILGKSLISDTEIDRLKNVKNYDDTEIKEALDSKQNILIAGNNVDITQNIISSVDTKYTAGEGINISKDNIISNTQTSAEWGNIEGDINSQIDLINKLDSKQEILTEANAGNGISIENGVITNTKTETSWGEIKGNINSQLDLKKEFDSKQDINSLSINGVTLNNNKTLNELGIQPEGDYLTKDELPKNITTQGNTFNNPNQLVQLLNDGTLPRLDASNLYNVYGEKGDKGDKGDTSTIEIGKVEKGINASVTNVGTNTDAIFDFVLPKGDTGRTATVKVGKVVKGDNASVKNVGTNNDAIFDFVLPKGDTGRTATVKVGKVEKGDNASVKNVGTNNDAIFDFVLPKGDQGIQGIQGVRGPQGIQGPRGEKGTTGDGYSDAYHMYKTGEVTNDVRGYNELSQWERSTFDRSKFTVVGTPNITDDGILSGNARPNANYIKTPISFGDFKNRSWEIRGKILFTTGKGQEIIIGSTSWAPMFGIVGASSDTSYRLTFRAIIGEDGDKTPEGEKIGFSVNKDGYLDYILKFDMSKGEYTLIGKTKNGEIISQSYTPPTKSKQLYFITSRPTDIITYLQTPDNVWKLVSQIDLKYTSISVDGKEVFNGNKTGIDIIKFDNFTKVGNPTITDDGIASGFIAGDNTGSYVKFPTFESSKLDNWAIYIKVKTSSDVTTTNTIFGQNRAGSGCAGMWTYVENERLYYAISDSLDPYADWFIRHVSGSHQISPNTVYYIKYEFTGNAYRIYLRQSEQEEWVLDREDISTKKMSDAISVLGIAQYGVSGTNMQSPFTGSIDLNAFKIYADGNLVYQPCLRIPYTLTSNNSKIVPASHRGAVEQFYEEFGKDNFESYYTIDHVNKNITLPHGEIYGMIKTANDGNNVGKMYMTGEVSNDRKAYDQLVDMKHSTFDKSKFTIIGTPNISDDGIASGFSKSEYIILPNNYIGGKETFILNLKCHPITNNTFSTAISNINNIRSFQVAFDGRTNQLRWALSSNNTSWDIGMFDDPLPYGLDVDYYIQLEKTKEKYILRISRDGKVYTVHKEINSTLSIYEGGKIVLGRSRDNLDEQFVGSIDLKQFSISVDGKEVFNGNKTGIDIIKKDNFTKVGTPVISADGIASNFNQMTGVRTSMPELATAKNWEFNIKFIPYSLQTYAQYFFWVSSRTANPLANLFKAQILTDGKVWFTVHSTESGGAGGRLFTYTTSNKAKLGQVNSLIIEYRVNEGYLIDFNGVKTLASDIKTKIGSTSDAFCFLGSDLDIEYLDGSIDLNSFKIYVDGNLVYQPLLRIPYTESKTGSKIVDSIYRDRVEDVFEQTGKALYYTLDEDNKNLTLPKGELYGLIGEGGVGNPDDKTIKVNEDKQLQAIGVLEQNKKSAKYDWVGTLAEYNAQNVGTTHPDWVCYITDDMAGNSGVYTKDEVDSIVSRISSNMPIGTIFPSAVSNAFIPANSLPCNGAEYTQKQFQLLYTNWLQPKNRVKLPTFTANSTDGFTVSTNGTTGKQVWEFLNKNVGNKPFFDTGWNNNEFKLECPKELYLNKYIIAIDNSGATEYPIDWEVLGSNDNSKWDILQKKTNQSSWSLGEIKSFVIAPSKKYKYFKLHFTKGTPPSTSTDLGYFDFDLYEEMPLLETCTYEEYQQDITTNGACAKFGVDIANGKFKVPTIPDGYYVKAGKGTANKAGLPNITGSAKAFQMFETVTAQGAFKMSNCSRTTSASQGSALPLQKLDFNASDSNPIYGASDTVETNAVGFRYFVVVATGAVKPTEVEWNTIIHDKANSDLSNLTQSGIDKLGVSRVIEAKYNPDGSWYRKWSDGWLEQGGNMADGPDVYDYRVNLVKPFASTNYQVQFTTLANNTNAYNIPWKALAIYPVSTTQFGCFKISIVRGWYACGVGA